MTVEITIGNRIEFVGSVEHELVAAIARSKNAMDSSTLYGRSRTEALECELKRVRALGVTSQTQMDILLSLMRKFPLGEHFRIAHDGYAGKVCGWYVRDDGAPGVNLQLDNAKVVHVYGTKWIEHLQET